MVMIVSVLFAAGWRGGAVIAGRPTAKRPPIAVKKVVVVPAQDFGCCDSACNGENCGSIQDMGCCTCYGCACGGACHKDKNYCIDTQEFCTACHCASYCGLCLE